MKNPVLIIINGLPASGKTTLAKRLGSDLTLPVLSRDGIFAVLQAGLGDAANITTDKSGSASFKLLYEFAGVLLAGGQSLIIEQFFGHPELRTAEFLELQRAHNFAPVQILCKASGHVLVERYLARMQLLDSQSGLQDAAGLAQYKEQLLKGELKPLALDGPLFEFDTTTSAAFNYSGLFEELAGLVRG